MNVGAVHWIIVPDSRRLWIVDGARVAVEFGPAVAEAAPVLRLRRLSTYKKARLW